MKHELSLKQVDESTGIGQRFEQLVAKLDKQVADFPPESVFLHGVVKHHPTRDLYHLSLALQLPNRTLAAQEEGRDPSTTLHEAFDEIERQLHKHKAQLRREHFWKRKLRRERLRDELRLDQVEEGKRALFRDLLLAHLKRLYNFIRREIAFHMATGDLLPGELVVEDVVDAVVLQAASEFSTRPSNVEVSRWLVKLAREQVAAEIGRLKQERTEFVIIEEDVPELSPEELVAGTDEIYEFYQPDETLTVADLLADPFVPTPEQILESRDFQRYINRMLAQLPKPWRDVFVLHHIEGFSSLEVSFVTGQTEEEVARDLDRARIFLRSKLLESCLGEALRKEQQTGNVEIDLFGATADMEVPSALRARLEEQLDAR